MGLFGFLCKRRCFFSFSNKALLKRSILEVPKCKILGAVKTCLVTFLVPVLQGCPKSLVAKYSQNLLMLTIPPCPCNRFGGSKKARVALTKLTKKF